MTDEERAEWQARYRAEVEEEDRRRRVQTEATEKRRQQTEDREVELAIIRQTAREAYYQEQGYVRYKDSRGTEIWLPADEYEQRTKRKKHRRNRFFENLGVKGQRFLLVAAIVFLGIALGLILGR